MSFLVIVIQVRGVYYHSMVFHTKMDSNSCNIGWEIQINKKQQLQRGRKMSINGAAAASKASMTENANRDLSK